MLQVITLETIFRKTMEDNGVDVGRDPYLLLEEFVSRANDSGFIITRRGKDLSREDLYNNV